MIITQANISFVTEPQLAWTGNWAWGLPLIVMTVIIHVLGLGLVSRGTRRVSGGKMEHRHPVGMFVAVMGTTTLLATSLHAVEAGIWGSAYLLLGALPDARTAMLYSLSAMTSYGHANLFLEDHWRLMGALEALNGWLLFGLTTAFLFGVIEKVGLLARREKP
jgi:xanthine/uracil permease